MEKRCFKCEKVKPLSEFSAHQQMADGHLGKCKACAIEYSRRHRREINPGYYQSYERARKNREERTKSCKERAATLRGKESKRVGGLKFRRKFPEKLSAHNKLKRAVANGIVLREPCVICGAPDAHGHHEDYAKPLDVIWLCEAHHKLVHKQVIYNPKTLSFDKKNPNDYEHLKTTTY